MLWNLDSLSLERRFKLNIQKIRVSLPSLDSEVQIHTAGVSLISLFAEDLFTFIDKSLIKSNGQDWLQKIQIAQPGLRNINFRDPSLLLKVLTESHNPELRTLLRGPLNALMPRNAFKDFYDGLSGLLEERNIWFHHEIDASPKELEQLAIDILRIVFKIEGLAVAADCQAILNIFNPPGSSEGVERGEAKEANETLQAIQEVSNSDEPAVGTAISETFLNQSYTLHTTGAIRDRKTDILLSDQYPEIADTLGTLLLARKPSGGRLKITSSGVIAGFFNDYWGYLARVRPDNWFKGHLESESRN